LNAPLDSGDVAARCTDIQLDSQSHQLEANFAYGTFPVAHDDLHCKVPRFEHT
jgi:hypothetical protein